MAVRLADTASDYLQRTTGLLPHAGNSTVCFWAKVAVVPVGFQTIYILMDSPGVYTDYVAFYGNTTNLELQDLTGNILGSPMTDAQWVHVAWTQTGTAQRFYLNATLVGTNTYNRSAVTVGDEFLGSDSTDTSHDVSFANVREWTTFLTSAQLLLEMQSETAVHTANLYMDCPMTSDLLDISGNGHDWTQVGSSTFVAGPSWPSNSSIATATAFGTLPQTITQDFGDGLYAWYSYTGRAGEVLFGALALSNLSDFLDLNVFQADGSSGVTLQAVNRPAEVPISTGQTVYLQVLSQTHPPTDAVAISLVPAPTSAVPVGAIFVNDEAAGFPAVLIDPDGSDYQVLRFSTFPSTFNENAGDVLDNGTFLIENDDAGSFQIYNGQLALVTTVTTSIPALTTSEVVRTCVAPQVWYIANPGIGAIHAKIARIDATGLETDTWTLPNAGLTALAASNDESIIYLAGQGGGFVDIVKQWITASSTFGADLLGHVAGSLTQDLLVLADDSIVVMRGDIRRYNAAGALLNTYTVTVPNPEASLFQSITPDISFWARVNIESGGTVGNCVFYEIKISDGTLLRTKTQMAWVSGVSVGDPSLTPLARFGPSQSCPAFILREAIVPSPAATPDPTLIRRERIFRHLSEEQQWIFYQWLQIDCEAGVGLSDGQGSDPQIILQWSDDGGHTWSNEHLLSAGKQGEYGKRSILKQPLGRSRDRVFKVAMSDPVRWALLNAYFGAEKGSS
jgi:hypothetical protein